MITRQKLFNIIAAVLLLVPVIAPSKVSAAELQDRRLQLSDSIASATNVTHTFSFDIQSTNDVGSIEFEYCSNDPFPGDPCVPPTGLDLSSVTLSSQSGETGFSIHGSSTSNRLVLTRPPSAVTPGPVEYVFDGATNPDQAQNTYYVRLGTFGSDDGTGARIDEGGIAFTTGDSIDVTTEVPPYLEFCVGLVILSNDCSTAAGNYIDFGTFATNNTSTGISKFAAATNAAFGYNVSVNGTTLYAGDKPIPAMSNRAPSNEGTSQFGMNLRANSDPNVGLEPSGPGTAQPATGYNTPNEFKYQNGENVVDNPSVSDTVTFTASYIVNVSEGQQPGVYATTLTYVCTATF